jgi:hypothetical protein
MGHAVDLTQCKMNRYINIHKWPGWIRQGHTQFLVITMAMEWPGYRAMCRSSSKVSKTPFGARPTCRTISCPFVPPSDLCNRCIQLPYLPCQGLSLFLYTSGT